MGLEKVERFLELLYQYKITNNYDRVILVIGDEGVGKSTFILELIVLWRMIRDVEIDIDEILELMQTDREGFKRALSRAPRRSVIAAPDAARIYHKKDAMDPDQKELEKDLLDVRMKENLILLGFQSWKTVPTDLAERRARNAFYIPRRGLVRGYDRESLDEKVDSGDWPRADLVDTFPSLEGTELWDQYRQTDLEAKQLRIDLEDEPEDEPKTKRERIDEVYREIKDERGIESVVGIHGGHNKPHIDIDMIQLGFDLSIRDARKVKKLLQNDDEIEVPELAEGQTQGN